jgi:hypothetical protein
MADDCIISILPIEQNPYCHKQNLDETKKEIYLKTMQEEIHEAAKCLLTLGEFDLLEMITYQLNDWKSILEFSLTYTISNQCTPIQSKRILDWVFSHSPTKDISLVAASSLTIIEDKTARGLYAIGFPQDKRTSEAIFLVLH